jgi:hypothetical protein
MQWYHGNKVLLNLCLTIPATSIPADGLDPEELELGFDFGAEEVFEDEDGILICFHQFWNHPKNLKIAILKSLSSGFEEFLKSLKKLTEAEMADVEID